MIITRHVSELLQSNMYVLTEGDSVVVVDPCMKAEIDKTCSEVLLLLTHEHYDHIAAVNWWKETYGAKLMCSPACAERIADSRKNCARYFEAFVQLQTWITDPELPQIDRSYTCSADRTIRDGEVLEWAGHRFECRELPGHSPGGMGFLLDQSLFFSGDNLIPGSDAEVRMPGGNAADWNRITKPFLDSLDDAVTILPGHREQMSVGEWKKEQGVENSKFENTNEDNRMEQLLEGKVIVVTGAGRGIGQAMATVFAQNGAIVYATDVRQGSVEEWNGEVNAAATGEVRSLYFDISDETQAKDALMQVKKDCGHIDGLVNNAGVEFNELIGMISRSNMEKMFTVNVYGTINMLQIVSRIMGRQEKGGSIVNIASMTALRGNRGQLVYSATKGAVVSLTKSAAKELAAKKIRVNAIAPGLTNTAMMQQADPEKLKSRIDNICMGRLAEPEDIAKATLFLLSDLSEYVSGQVLAVDGCTIM